MPIYDCLTVTPGHNGTRFKVGKVYAKNETDALSQFARCAPLLKPEQMAVEKRTKTVKARQS